MISISGIRGVFGDGLDPVVLARFTAAYGTWARRRSGQANPVVVVGRDARVTGDVCARIVSATLQATGCSVVDVGLATTPTVEMAVMAEHAAGGIILSASHNPAEWNALKLLNEKGEFFVKNELDDWDGFQKHTPPVPAAADSMFGGGEGLDGGLGEGLDGYGADEDGGEGEGRGRRGRGGDES